MSKILIVSIIPTLITIYSSTIVTTSFVKEIDNLKAQLETNINVGKI